MGILAKACVFPGTAGLLANLFASSSLVDVGPLEPPCKDWNEEFVDGTQWEGASAVRRNTATTPLTLRPPQCTAPASPRR